MPVQLQFYGESLSPSCQAFVNGPLNDVLSTKEFFDGFPPLVEYEYFPWGNAYYNTSKCGGATFSKNSTDCWAEQCGGDTPPAECFAGTPVCQHGPAECKANTIEACAINLYPMASTFGPFIKCWEGDKKVGAAT